MISLQLKLESNSLVFCLMLRNRFSLHGLDCVMMAKHLPGFYVYNIDKGNTKAIRDQI